MLYFTASKYSLNTTAAKYNWKQLFHECINETSTKCRLEVNDSKSTSKNGTKSHVIPN